MVTRIILPLAALAMMIFAIASVVSSRPSREFLPPPERPAQTTFKDQVAAVGLVEASSENIAISTPVAGLVMQVYVKAGDLVKADQPLFGLDDRDLQAALGVRGAMLEVARQKLARLEAQPRAEEVPPLEARLREAEAALADAMMQLRLIESVTDRRAIREEDLNRRRFAVQAARARRDEAHNALELIKAGAWQPEIKTAQAEVKAAEAQVKQIETDIERLTVRAPVSGAVLQSNVRRGEYAQAAVRGNARLTVPIHFVRFEPYILPKRVLSGATTERTDTRVLQVIYRLERVNFPLYVGQQLDVFLGGARPDGPVAADGPVGGLAPATAERASGKGPRS